MRALLSESFTQSRVGSHKAVVLHENHLNFKSFRVARQTGPEYQDEVAPVENKIPLAKHPSAEPQANEPWVVNPSWSAQTALTTHNLCISQMMRRPEYPRRSPTPAPTRSAASGSERQQNRASIARTESLLRK